MRVLVADTDTFVREAVCNLLRWHRIHCTEAAHYHDAWEWLSLRHWDVALIASCFPRTRRGLDLADRAEGFGIRAVVMSELTAPLVAVEAKGLRVLAKPIGVGALLDAVTK